MSQITKISPQKKPGRFNIFLEGKYAFSLSEEVLLSAGLRQGDELADAQISKILDDDLQSKILSKILDFISYQRRSERELKEKLNLHLLKYVSDENLREVLKEKILGKIRELGLVDDAAFAKAYVSGQLLSRNPAGKFKLKQFLFKKGIPSEIIHDALESYESPKELEGALAASERKLKLIKAPNERERMAKLWKFLASRGYSSDVIKAVVDTKFKIR